MLKKSMTMWGKPICHKCSWCELPLLYTKLQRYGKIVKTVSWPHAWTDCCFIQVSKHLYVGLGTLTWSPSCFALSCNSLRAISRTSSESALLPKTRSETLAFPNKILEFTSIPNTQTMPSLMTPFSYEQRYQDRFLLGIIWTSVNCVEYFESKL